jgi:hypothetical protein
LALASERDANPNGVDEDPSFVWNAGGIRIFDDATGVLGAYDLTFAEVP